MVERLCSGLQLRVRRFESGSRLQLDKYACMLICPGGEIGRHKGFKIPRLMVVPVRVWLRAPIKRNDF